MKEGGTARQQHKAFDHRAKTCHGAFCLLGLDPSFPPLPPCGTPSSLFPSYRCLSPVFPQRSFLPTYAFLQCSFVDPSFPSIPSSSTPSAIFPSCLISIYIHCFLPLSDCLHLVSFLCLSSCVLPSCSFFPTYKSYSDPFLPAVPLPFIHLPIYRPLSPLFPFPRSPIILAPSIPLFLSTFFSSLHLSP